YRTRATARRDSERDRLSRTETLARRVSVAHEYAPFRRQPGQAAAHAEWRHATAVVLRPVRHPRRVVRVPPLLLPRVPTAGGDLAAIARGQSRDQVMAAND